MTRRTALAATLALVVSAVGVRTTTEYRHSMRLFKSQPENQVCAHAAQGCPWTNGMRVVPHHDKPVWSHPWLAADTNNFIALCDPPKDRRHGCHGVCAHNGCRWATASEEPRKCKNRRER
jgi:hypothetical protein